MSPVSSGDEADDDSCTQQSDSPVQMAREEIPPPIILQDVDTTECPVRNNSMSVCMCEKNKCCECEKLMIGGSHACAKCKRPIHAICGSAFFDENGEIVDGPRVCTRRPCQNARHGNYAPYVRKQSS